MGNEQDDFFPDWRSCGDCRHSDCTKMIRQAIWCNKRESYVLTSVAEDCDEYSE